MSDRGEPSQLQKSFDRRFSKFKPEGVQTGALGHVPDPDALVLAVAQDQLLSAHDKSKDGNFGKSSPGVKDGTANIVVVAPACIHLPSLVGERRSLAIMVVFRAYIFQTITIVLIIDTIKRLFCSNHIGSY